jgi:protein-disulfide isomerase
MLDRRRTLRLSAIAGLAALSPPGRALSQAANQWFGVQGDDGHPVPNGRAPVELVEEIEDLPGALWSGPAESSVRLVEFYDYNCPWCRAAQRARDELRRDNRDLRLGIVNNPILSPASAQAAKVDLAVLQLKGAGASYALHRALFSAPGRIDGPRALAVAETLGLDRREVERLADTAAIGESLGRQMRLAASLGIAATPSYVIGGATLLGYPGPKALARIVADTRTCGAIAC